MDRIDFAILAELQNDARLSNKELSNRVNLAPSSCLERVKRLRDSGVLLGFHARVDPKALGVGLQAMIAINLDHHAARVVESIQEYMLENPAVIAVYYLAGKTDLIVHVAVRDAEHLREVAVDFVSARKEVAHVETSLIFDHRHREALPNYRTE